MKKVLALVLAVIMVCTMAMAVTINGITPASTSTTYTPDGTMKAFTPGVQFAFCEDELYGGSMNIAAPYKVDGKFVPEKNYVEIVFGAGANLVESQGWVKANDDKYYYCVNLKDDTNLVLDNAADLIFNSITATVYGNSDKNTWEFVKNGKYVCLASATGTNLLTGVAGSGSSYVTTLGSGNMWLSKFDIGYVPMQYKINDANGDKLMDASYTDTTTVTLPTTGEYKVTFAAGLDDAGKTLTKSTIPVDNDTGTGTYASVKAVATASVKVGDVAFFNNNLALGGKATTVFNQNLADNGATLILALNNGVTLPTDITIDNAKESYKLYSIDTATGAATLVPTSISSTGITTAKVTSAGYLVLVDGTLTATAAPSTPGTTNPGTGANDVVGVAAALAVVALVSGAAISLKK